MGRRARHAGVVALVCGLAFAPSALAHPGPFVRGQCPGESSEPGFHPAVNPKADAWPVYQDQDCGPADAPAETSPAGTYSDSTTPIRSSARPKRQARSRRCRSKRSRAAARKCSKRKRRAVRR